MNKPKRYKLVCKPKAKPEMVFDETGEWTTLSEYYTLHDRLNEARNEIEKLKAKLSLKEVQS